MSLTALLGFDTFYKKAFISFSIIQWVITISKVSLPFQYKILILGVYIPITIKSRSLSEKNPVFSSMLSAVPFHKNLLLYYYYSWTLKNLPNVQCF